MNTSELTESLTTLFSELVRGAPKGWAFMLNSGDPGLLASLDRLSAQEASTVHDGGASVAAHVDHMRYGLSLMNRWAGGEENPFADADWAASWERNTVSDAQWTALRASLREEAESWLGALGKLETLHASRPIGRVELNGIVGSVAHLAYHLGAIRQMDRRLKGPPATG